MTNMESEWCRVAGMEFIVLPYELEMEGFPWWCRGYDFTFQCRRVQVQCLVREGLKFSKMSSVGTSLEAWWLRLRFPVQGVWGNERRSWNCSVF